MNLAKEKSQNEYLTYDARGNGDGKISCTITGGHQNRITDYTAIVIEIKHGKDKTDGS